MAVDEIGSKKFLTAAYFLVYRIGTCRKRVWTDARETLFAYEKFFGCSFPRGKLYISFLARQVWDCSSHFFPPFSFLLFCSWFSSFSYLHSLYFSKWCLLHISSAGSRRYGTIGWTASTTGAYPDSCGGDTRYPCGMRRGIMATSSPGVTSESET